MRTRTFLLSLALILTGCEAADEAQDDTEPPISVPPTETPPPPNGDSNSAPAIITTNVSGQEGLPLSATIRATDSENDAITFSLLDGPVWMDLTADGGLSGQPVSASVGTFEILVEANDGKESSTAEITIDIAYDPIEQALRTGDYRFIVDETDLSVAEAMQQELERTRTRNNADITELYALNPNGEPRADSLTNVTFSLSQQASLIVPAFGNNMPLIQANTTRRGDSLDPPNTAAVIGRYEHARFAVFGDNPFRLAAQNAQSVSEDAQQLFENTITWLIEADPANGARIVIANMPEDNSHPDQSTTRDWLTDAFGEEVSYNEAGVCDGDALWSCLTDDTSLIILSQHTPTPETPGDLIRQLTWALEDGVPVLFLTGVDGLNATGREILDLLKIRYVRRNIYGDKVAEFSPVGELFDWQPEAAVAFAQLIDQVEQDNARYDLSGCFNYWTCHENPDFNTNVVAPLIAMRRALDEVANSGRDAFPATAGLRWQGFALLLGDDYRSRTTFPMSKTETPNQTFIRAMIGDAVTIIARGLNPVANLGTVGPAEYPAHLRTNKTVTLTPVRPFRSTGVFAFPGESFKVTRTDESDVGVRLKVNTIRTHAGSPFRTVYERPLFMESRLISIAPGETRTFTSSFGGAIQAYFNTSDQEITLEFENVGEHPVWRGPEDTTTFLNEVQSSDYEWVEFVTPYFEVHSQRSKMAQTFGRPYSSTPRELADMIATYIRDWPHWLAGREGPGISPNPDLRAFAETHGLTIPIVDAVKHMNADRASCTAAPVRCAGTSGNPYDANWFFDPIFRGDLHELGHGLEYRARHHFEGGDATHSTTNLYAINTQYRYYLATGQTDFGCPGLPYEASYSTVQASRLQRDPAQYMRDANLSSAAQQMTMFVQLFAALENQGVLEDGWLMMPRLNLVTGEFQAARNDDLWAAKADGLGFGGMDRETAFSLSQNDWLLIALSWSAQRDLREYLDMWGYIYSDTALDQVARMNFPSLRPAYYAIGSTDHCFGLKHDELPIDGRTSWKTNALSAKASAFTPDYLQFAEHEHDAFCSLGTHADADAQN